MPELRSRLQAALEHKFRVIRELTGGGMSRIFLAEEVALEREVVVKVLAPHLVDERAVQRFHNEVLQTARLQHPTIVSVFEVGALDGADGFKVPFFIMPYVRGESLHSRLRHEGALPLHAAVRILRSVLDALVYAHAHGVVHRDIKPGNIFLAGSNAVLADFGIAKAVSGPQRAEALTSPGSTVGTPAYMAPEQFMGEEGVDHRADLYSVGVVAYEMLTGRLPWTGGHPADLRARAENPIAPLRPLRPDVPPELTALIEQCIEWNAANRPATAAEVLRAVEAYAHTPMTPTSMSSLKLLPLPRRPRQKRAVIAVVALIAIAVLGTTWLRRHQQAIGHGPMRLALMYPELNAETRGDSTLNEYVYHMLVSSLHPVLGLQLVGEVSVPVLHAHGLRTAQIADSLGLDSVLVLQTTAATTPGERLLQVELLERHSGRQTILASAGPASLRSWQSLSPDSVQSLLKLVAGQVATRLGLTSSNAVASTTQKTDAWIAWSRGRDASLTRTPAGMRDAIRWYKRAIALDSLYVQAQSDLSLAMSNAMWYRYRTEDSPLELAVSALRFADRAVALRPDFPEGYLARGYIGMLAGAPVAYLEDNYGAAQRLASANPFSRTWYNGVLAAQGKLNEALASVEAEVRRDPGSPGQRITLALYALGARQYVTAIRSAREAHVLAPAIPLTSSFELWGLLAMGGRAQNECVSVNAGPYLGARALCLERTGHESEGRQIVDSLSRIITARAPMDTTFDLSLFISEMAFYASARGDGDAERWLRNVFHESPAGIDFRLMKSAAFFTPRLVAIADSLRHDGWIRIQRMAGAGRVASAAEP